MSTPPPVCLFCRKFTSYRENSSDHYVPSFLTYLKTINVINFESNYENDFPHEDFHCCRKCGALLGTIFADVRKLRADLLKIYTVTFENLEENEPLQEDNVLENWRRKSVAHPVSGLARDLVIVSREQSSPDHETRMEEEQLPIKIEREDVDLDTEIGVKVEIEEDDQIGEFILPDFAPEMGPDPLELLPPSDGYRQEDDKPPEMTPSSSTGPLPLPRKGRGRVPIWSLEYWTSDSSHTMSAVYAHSPTNNTLIKMPSYWGVRKRDRRKYICALCNKRFSSLGGYNTHMETHTRNAECLDAKLPCPVKGCRSIFYAVAKRDRHVEIVHSRKPFSCPTCSQAFARKEMLAIHQEFNHS
ncbi:zinc finger protein 200 isoform X2 [Folsomia candida]|uniref:zinc finger protein 200 isoform X2 n=1 Tax=Folsomia candida TaxID=158441 RepID=UPI0016051C0D|nr:zinc finger protein 200 isoform X2 [Folsomia candida]